MATKRNAPKRTLTGRSPLRQKLARAALANRNAKKGGKSVKAGGGRGGSNKGGKSSKSNE